MTESMATGTFTNPRSLNRIADSPLHRSNMTMVTSNIAEIVRAQRWGGKQSLPLQRVPGIRVFASQGERKTDRVQKLFMG